jgi:hypothetical protein
VFALVLGVKCYKKVEAGMKAAGWRTDLRLSCGNDAVDPNCALTSTYLVVPSFVSIFIPF